ncbi:MAG TPA: oligosaccharide flippase family protein [Anaerolineae bacterium]|nr:oligosaccharide flippase family protein [Anaerolineae bacterium]
MSLLRRYQSDILLVLSFLILPLILYGPVLLNGRSMIPADNLTQWAPWAPTDTTPTPPHNNLLSDLLLENYPWKEFIRQSWDQRELPLWNPYLFAGAPFMATGQNMAYYPFSLIFLILPTAAAYGWYTVSQLWLAAISMYIFGRVLGQSRSAAALAALIYQGCGFMLVSAAVFPMIIGAAVWLPILLACIEKILRHGTNPQGNTLPWLILGAGFLGVQVMAGHIEITLYTLLVMGALSAWRLLWGWRTLSWRTLLRPAIWLLTLVFLGLMLSAIQLIPLYEIASVNFREGSASLAEVRGWGFPPRRALTFVLPDFFGNPADHGYRDAFTGQWTPLTTNYHDQLNPHGATTTNWGIKNYVEGGVYLGLLPLFLAILGIIAAFRPTHLNSATAIERRRLHTSFFSILSFFSIGFIFGTPLYALIYALPFFNQLHSPFRWIFPLSLSVAVLTGFGWDYFQHLRQQNSPWPQRFAISFASLGLLSLLALLTTRFLYPSLEPQLNNIFLGLAQASDAFPHVEAFYSYLFWQCLHVGLVILAIGFVLWQGKTSLAFTLLLIDLALIGYGFNANTSTDLLTYRPAMVQWLDQQPGHWRLTSFDSSGQKPFNANAGWLFNFQDIRGYDSIIPKQYTDYMTAIEPQNELQFNRVQPLANWQSINSPLLDLLGAKFIITHETLDLPKLQLAWEGEGVRIYENLAAMPRAFTLPLSATSVVTTPLASMSTQDPRQHAIIAQDDWHDAPNKLTTGINPNQDPTPASPTPATITQYSPITVIADTTLTEPSWLILNDSYFPGWNAYYRPQNDPSADETRLDIIRVNANFRAVRLPAGEWQVRFRYSPLSFKLGGLISAMGALIMLFAIVVWGWRRFYRTPDQMSNAHSIAKNSIAPMFLNLFNRGIDFVFAAFYLRILGSGDAGGYATAITIAGWFEIISNFGLNTLIIREVSQDKDQSSRYLLNTSVLRIGTSLVASVPIIIYLTSLNAAGRALDAQITSAILFIMIGMLFSGIGQGLAGLFYAYERAELPAAITTVTTILKVAFGVIALLFGFGFVGLAAVSIIVNLVTLAILAAATYRFIPLPRHGWRIDFPLQRTMLISSYPLMLNHLLAVIFFQIDIPILQQINGKDTVGWYNSAYKWVNAFNVIPSFFTFALFPVISRQVHENIDEAFVTFRLSLKLMLLVALPLGLFITIWAYVLIGMLGGNEFLPHGAIALQLVIWSIPFGWLNSVINYVLIAIGQERRLTRAFLVGVIFNTVANLILLPTFSYQGAAVTTILSEIILLVMFNIYLRARFPAINWIKLTGRLVTATVVTAVVIFLTLPLHLLVATIAGLITYPLMLWRLNIFTPSEAAVLRTLIPAPVAQRLKLA